MSEPDIAIGCRNLWKVYGPVTAALDDVADASVPSICEQLRDDGCVVGSANVNVDVGVGEFFVLFRHGPLCVIGYSVDNYGGRKLSPFVEERDQVFVGGRRLVSLGGGVGGITAGKNERQRKHSCRE